MSTSIPPGFRHTLWTVAATVAVAACASDSPRETVFDRVVHIEPALHTEIPVAERWCDRIDALDRRTVDVAGTSLYVETEGNGVPLVLLHGGPGGSHHYFHPWFSRAAEFAQVIYYDQRGCGLSGWDAGPNGYSVEQAVDDLEALRVALGFERWVVLGYSYGGFLAQLYSITYPESVQGLVLSNAVAGTWNDLGPSRQQDFISQEEDDRMSAARAELAAWRDEHPMSDQEYFQLFVYNNLLNGDWKRQHLHRPSAEDFVHMARYEAHFDSGFNGAVNETVRAYDLEGAFAESPWPTLVLEGSDDLTWGVGKREEIRRNHPRATFRLIENAGHSMYDDNPDAYFDALRGFLEALEPPSRDALDRFRVAIARWDAERRQHPLFVLRSASPGPAGSRTIAAAYDPAWNAQITSLTELMKLGFGLYDEHRYDEALGAFARMDSLSTPSGAGRSIALLWQGHLLDLLDRREEALRRYEAALDIGLTSRRRNARYELEYRYDEYARTRLSEPFARRENVLPN